MGFGQARRTYSTLSRPEGLAARFIDINTGDD